MGISIKERLKEWTQGKNATDARLNIFHRIREIPYAVVPEINDANKYMEMLTLNKGSCTPKHLLLGNMYERLGMFVLYSIYPFRWDEVEIDYPPQLKRLAEDVPTSYHLACRVDIGAKLTLVDATVDTALKVLGLPVNDDWDGVSDTRLPITPCGEEQLYHPIEAELMQARYDEKALKFYSEMNHWLEKLRQFLH